MKMKGFAVLAAVASFLFVMYAVSDGKNSLSVESQLVEAHGVHMLIPHQYLSNSDRFWWIEHATGMDVDRNSVRYKISLEELDAVVPGIRSLVSAHIHTIGGVLFINDIEEMQSSIEHSVNVLNAQIHRKGRYKEVVFEPDPDTRFFRMYTNAKLRTMWSVFIDSPENLIRSEQLTGHEHIATCTELELLSDYSCSTLFKYDRFVVQGSIPGKLLPHFFDIRDHIIGLLKQWQLAASELENERE